MFRLFRKRRAAIENWHSKAMLRDPKKTRLTIINIETLNRQSLSRITLNPYLGHQSGILTYVQRCFTCFIEGNTPERRVF